MSAITKSNATNSLKPPLTKSPFGLDVELEVMDVLDKKKLNRILVLWNSDAIWANHNNQAKLKLEWYKSMKSHTQKGEGVNFEVIQYCCHLC